MIDHFGLLAPVYDRLIGPPDPERWPGLLQLPVAGSLLDAGGGTGRVSRQLRSLVDRLVVCDLSRSMLKQGQGADRLRPIQARTEQLPFGTGTFERVLVVDALHHFGDQGAAVGELLRVLKPGGRLVIEEPDIGRLAVKAIALVEKMTLMRSRFYSAAEIRDMATARGWPARIESNGGFAVWIIVDKPSVS